MMFGSFVLDKEKYVEKEEELLMRLSNSRDPVSVSSLRGLVGGGDEDWFSLEKVDTLKSIVVIMEDYNMLRIEIKDLDVRFTFDDSLKKLFILQMSEEFESKATLNSAIQSLVRVNGLESDLGKSFKDFDEKEMARFITKNSNEMMYHKIRNNAYILGKFQDFYKKYFEYNFSWKEFSKNNKLTEVLDGEVRDYIVTKKDLVSLTNKMYNLQESIIPLLIFEGVLLSKIEEDDELRYLKGEDVKENKIVIRNRDQSVKREIEIDKDIADTIALAYETMYNMKVAKHVTYMIELEDTPYVVRPTINAKKKKHNVDVDAISFRGAFDRVKKCRTQFELDLFDVDFTPTKIKSFGKIHYVEKYLSEGLDLTMACRKTLMRFGDWRGEDLSTAQEAVNVQSVMRLKNIYKVYKN